MVKPTLNNNDCLGWFLRWAPILEEESTERWDKQEVAQNFRQVLEKLGIVK